LSPREGIDERVYRLVSNVLGVPEHEITRDASFVEHLQFDSLDAVHFLIELEEEFNVEVPEDEYQRMLCVGDVVDWLVDHGIT